MAPNGQKQDTKNWYRISVDAVRAWTTILAILVIAGGGFWGYTLLARHLLERDVSMTIEQSEDLLERLQTEQEIGAHRDNLDIAADRLGAAKSLVEAGELEQAGGEAQKSLSLLTSIANALRHRSPDGEAQFIAVQGNVEVRRGERGEWRQARSRMQLYAGDYVKTSANGSAEGMMVDGTLFTVRPNTVLLVTRTRSMLGLRSERTLALESGWVNLSTAQTASRVMTPEAEARVEQRSDAVVAYDEGLRRGSFSNHRGGLKVASLDGTTRDVGELELVVQGDDGLSEAVPLPAAPRPGEPADNREFSLEDTNSVVLSWRPVKGASSYALQVSQSRLFVDNIIDVEERTKTSATLGLRGEGSFVWRVAAMNGDGQRGPWSTILRFRVASAPSGAEVGADQIPSQEG